MLWSESISARCRGAALQDNTLIQTADVIWEDSVVGPSGHVFCIGMTQQNTFFKIQYDYDIYEKQETPMANITLFPSVDKVKEWLRELKAENHPKAAEILPIMRFFLT